MSLRLYAAAALVLALLGAGWWGKGVLEERRQLRAEVASKDSELQQFKDAYEATSRVLTQRLRNTTTIKENTRYVTVEIEKRRPGAECELPADWRVLHDAAALGTAATP